MQKNSTPKRTKETRYLSPGGNLPDPHITLRRKNLLYLPMPLMVKIKRSPLARLFS